MLIFHKMPKSTYLDPLSICEQDLRFIHTLAKELGVNHLEPNTIHLGHPSESGAHLLRGGSKQPLENYCPKPKT